MALSGLVGVLNNGAEVLSRVNASVVDGRSCKLVAGRHAVCFFPCMRYNYCHHDQSCCTHPARLPVALTSLDELLGTRVKVRGGAACTGPTFTVLDQGSGASRRRQVVCPCPIRQSCSVRPEAISRGCPGVALHPACCAMRSVSVVYVLDVGFVAHC